MEIAFRLHPFYMRTLIAIVSFVFLATAVSAQVVLEGLVVDANDGVAIPGVFILKNGQQKGTMSDQNGVFELEVKIGDKLTISHVAYEDKKLVINEKMLLNQPLQIKLTLNVNTIGQANVFAEAKPDTVFGHLEYNVGDFVLLPNGQKLLLCYTTEKRFRAQADHNKRPLRGGRLVLLDFRNVQIATFAMSNLCYGLELIMGYLPIMSTEDGRFEVNYENKRLSITPLRAALEELTTEQIIDSVSDGLIYSTFHPNTPQFNYILHRTQSHIPHKWIAEVSDSAQLYRFRSTWQDLEGGDKVIAMRKAMQWGIDKEIVAGFMSGYSQSPFFRKLYAPMYKVGQEYVLLNPYKQKIFYFDEKGELVRAQNFTFPMSRLGLQWSEIIYDHETKRMWARYGNKTRTFLQEISLNKGTLSPPIKLYHRNVEKVEIRGNQVFYIYRPFDSPQKKYLYSEFLVAAE